MFAQVRFQLPQTVRPPKPKWRLVSPRPHARTVGNHKQRRAPWPQHTPNLVQQIRLSLAGLKPMQHDQAIHRPCRHGPQCFFDHHRMVWHPIRPGHNPLLTWHQVHHPSAVRKKRAQHWPCKPEPRNRLPFGIGPHLHNPLAQRTLRNPPQFGAIIKGMKINYIQVHCIDPIVQPE